MSNKEALVTELTVDDRKQNQQLKQSESRWKKYGSRIAAVAAVATAAFIASQKKAMDFGSSIAKGARQLRITTDLMQQLKAIEAGSGVSADAMAGAINTNKRFERGGAGKSGFGGAFAEMGVTPDTFKGLDDISKFFKMIHRLKDIQNPDVRQRAAQNLFGNNANAAMSLAQMPKNQLGKLEDTANQPTMTTTAQSITALENTKNLINSLARKGNPADFMGSQVSPRINPYLEQLDQWLGQKGLFERVLNKIDRWTD